MADNARSQSVSLGCGTLILIALIVLIFSNRGVDDLERDVERLETGIGELKESVDAQTKQIELLRDQLGRGQPEEDLQGDLDDAPKP